MQRANLEDNADRFLRVEFRHVAKVDEAATMAAGETKWMNVEYITIHIPGDRTQIFDGPVTDRHRARFSERYGRWRRGQSAELDGTPITTWPGITPAEVNMLAQGGIHTVEALAGLSDGNAGKVGPVLALRDKARRYLDAAKTAAPLEALNAKLREKDGQIAALTEQMHGMMARIDAMMNATPNVPPSAQDEAPPRRGPGRPPKSEQRPE